MFFLNRLRTLACLYRMFRGVSLVVSECNRLDLRSDTMKVCMVLNERGRIVLTRKWRRDLALWSPLLLDYASIGLYQGQVGGYCYCATASSRPLIFESWSLDSKRGDD